MKITGVETFHVKPRWIFVKVTTDEGIIGWGECDLEGYNLVTAAAVDSLKDIIIGQDPRNIEYPAPRQTNPDWIGGGYCD